MHYSEQINEIATALAKAQAAIQNPKKESKNPHFSSKYADLATGIEAVRADLSAHNICYVQSTSMDGDILMLETRLIHSSGQWIASHYPVCRFPTKHQEAGSALTYARRYSLFALVGIAGDDDDVNEASKSETPAPQRRKIEPPTPELLSDEDSDKAKELMLHALNMCATREELHDWARANSATKNRLTKDDQELVSSAFSVRQHAIKNQKDAA